MTMRRSRKLLLLAAAAVLLLGAGITTSMGANASTTGCQVRYATAAEAPGTFAGTVTIRNLGEPLSPWTLRWSFRDGEQITDGWNGTFSQTADQVTVTNARRVTELRTDRRVTVGFHATYPAGNPVPNDFTLNGVPCTGRGATTPTSPDESPSGGTQPAGSQPPAGGAPSGQQATSGRPVGSGQPAGSVPAADQQAPSATPATPATLLPASTGPIT